MSATMSCIQFQSPPFPLHSQAKHKLQFKTNTLLLPSSQEQPPTRLVIGSRRMPMKTSAITNSIILGVTSPKGGDISVLLPTGALLLFVYGIANFVVPVFISKYYQFDKPSDEDERPSDN